MSSPYHDHRFAAPRFFEDLAVGEEFYIPSRTVTEAHFAAFAALSGDNHPIHYDREYCRLHGHPDLLAHGLHVAALGAAGAGIFPHVLGEALVAFLDQSCRFLRPVYAGDSVYPRLRVSALAPQRTTGVVTLAVTIENQRGERVLEGEHRYLVKKRPAG